MHRKVKRRAKRIQKGIRSTLRRHRPASHDARASGDAGLELKDAGAGAGNGTGSGGEGGGVAIEEEVTVRLVDAVEGGQVGGLSDVIDEDEGSKLQRVGELVDGLLGDELVHPYSSVRKNLARKSSVHGGAQFSSDCKSLRPVKLFTSSNIYSHF